MFGTYIIQSDKDNRYYIGQSNNPQKRLEEHNKGNSFSTKAYRPWKLVFVKYFSTRSEAIKYEKYLKSLKKRINLEKIIGEYNDAGWSSGSSTGS